MREWLAADADDRAADDPSLGEGVSCDAEGCVAPMADGHFVALSLQPDGLADDCARAALIVTARAVPPGCQATVIALDRLRAQGAIALRRRGAGFIAEVVRPAGTNRPWAPNADAIKTESVAGASRTIDATPDAELQTEE